MSQTNQIMRGAEILAWISAASDGEVWGIDSSGTVLRYQQASQTWQSMPQPASRGLSQLSVGSAAQVWGIDLAGKVYRYGGGETGWQEIPGTLKWISAAADGTVCGVDTAGVAYRYVGEPSIIWQPMPGRLSQISVGNAESIWGIDDAGTILRYEQSSQTWQQISGQLASMSVGADGSVWGIDNLGNTFLYVEEPLVWFQTAFVGKHLSAGSFALVWGIDDSGRAVELTDRGITEAQVHWIPTDAVVDPLRGSGFWYIDEDGRYDDTKNTHLWIVIRAARLATQDFIVGRLIASIIPHSADAPPLPVFYNALCQGLYDCDYQSPFNDSGSYVSHFFNPQTGLNWANKSRPTALTQGRYYFKLAHDAYLANNIQDAGYNLGVSLHYLTDVTQPMHAANFTYLSLPVKFHTTWEQYAQTLLSEVTPPENYIQQDLGTEPDPYLEAAAWQAYNYFYSSALFKSFPTASPPADWQEITRQEITKILRSAVQITSQYLVAWFRSINSSLQWTYWSNFSASQFVTAPGAPVAALWRPPLHRDLFVTDGEGRIWNLPYEQPEVQPWFPIGPKEDAQASPGAQVTSVWLPRGRGIDRLHLDLFIADREGRVRSSFWEPTAGWQPWFPIHPEGAPQTLPGAPVTAVWRPFGPLHLDLFVIDQEGSVMTTFWEPTAGWQPWFPISPRENVQAQPGASVTAVWLPTDTLHLDLFMTDREGSVMTTFWEPTAKWQAWFPIHPEGAPTTAPGASVTAVWLPRGRGADGLHLDLFVTDNEGSVMTTFWEPTAKWQAWFPIHPEGAPKGLPGAPVTAVWRPFDTLHLDLFVTDNKGHVKSTFWEPAAKWQAWFSIPPGGAFQAAPGALVTAVWRPGRLYLDLFMTDREGNIIGTFARPFPS